MTRFPMFAEYFCILLEKHESGKTLAEVANRLGVTQGTISKIKTGYALPSQKLADTMAKQWGEPSIIEEVRKAKENDSGKILRHSRETSEEIGLVSTYIEELMKNANGQKILGRYLAEFKAGEVSETTKNEVLFALMNIYKKRNI